MASLHKRFRSKCEAIPPEAFTQKIPEGKVLFQQVEWDDWWDDANMQSVFAYLRGGNTLELGEWRSLFPTHL